MADDDPRTRILDAAELAIAERGKAGARVAAIAEAAGVNKAMLYYYFGSKDDLYAAVLERVLGQVEELASTALSDAGSGPLERLEAFMDGYRAVLVAHPNFARVMVREILDGGAFVGKLFRERIGPLMPMAAMTMEQARRAGQFNEALQMPMVGPVMVSPFIFYAFAKPILSEVFGPLTDDFADTYHRTAKEVLFNGLRARGPAEPTEEAP